MLTNLSSHHFLSFPTSTPSNSSPPPTSPPNAPPTSSPPSTTDLLPLSTHQIKTSTPLPSNHLLCAPPADASHSPDLAFHLAVDLPPLLSPASRLPFRRKSIAAALAVIFLTPDFFLVLFPKLVESLSDPNTVAVAVNVFCELMVSDPKPTCRLRRIFTGCWLKQEQLSFDEDCEDLCEVGSVGAKIGEEGGGSDLRFVDSRTVSRWCLSVKTVILSFSRYEEEVGDAVAKVVEGFFWWRRRM